MFNLPAPLPPPQCKYDDDDSVVLDLPSVIVVIVMKFTNSLTESFINNKFTGKLFDFKQILVLNNLQLKMMKKYYLSQVKLLISIGKFVNVLKI